MKNLDSQLMSFCSLISCLIVIFISKLWLKYSDKLYNKFYLMLFLEVIVYFILLILFLSNNISTKIYYIADTLLFASITRSIICGGTRLKAIRYKDKDRESFDNKSTIFCNVASVLGFAISSIIKIPINTAFIFMFIGISVDNYLYYRVYKKTKKDYNLT